MDIEMRAGLENRAEDGTRSGRGVEGAARRGVGGAVPTAWIGRVAAEHARWLAGVARREGLTGEDAVDAVQEAFAKLLTMPEAEAETLAAAPEEARSFLASLVRNVARNMRRKHHRAQPHAGIEDSEGLADEMPTVDALLLQAEDRARVTWCVRTLKEIHQRVVGLRVLEELSGQEAAERLELSAGHVAVLLHRAKGELLACLSASPVASPLEGATANEGQNPASGQESRRTAGQGPSRATGQGQSPATGQGQSRATDSVQ